MGVQIIAEAPPSASSYDYWKLYRASTKTGTYAVINGTNGQLVSDLTYYDESGTSSNWYKVSYYDSSTSTESTLSGAIQGISQTYTTVSKVAALLQHSGFTDSTTPTVQQVIEIINRIEDKLDDVTGHAWRLRYSGTTSSKQQTAIYEYYDIDFNYKYQTGRDIYLKHRKIRTLSTSEGDLMEIWDGSAWTDFIAGRTEDRGGDFWLDYDRGILFIKQRYGIRKPMAMRMKYRYGDETVPGTVEDVATKMVAIELMQSDFRSVLLTESENHLSQQQRIENWKESIDNDLPRLKEYQVMAIHM